MIEPDVQPTTASVALHYDQLDLAYRRIWGTHIHHGYWQTGRETAAAATDALSDLVAERLMIRPGDALCDIGCGYGATAARFATGHSVTVTGFTLSAAQQRVAGERPAPGVAILVRDWLDNALPDACFDGAYAIESSEHFADKAAFFNEASRVLRPGGRLVICAWLEGDRVRPWQVRHLLKPICSEGRLPSLASRADYQSLAARSGLAFESFEDLTRNVRKTWRLCLQRLLTSLTTDPDVRSLALGGAKGSRSFMLSLPRLIVAMQTGAMGYGLFVWSKPLAPSGIPRLAV